MIVWISPPALVNASGRATKAKQHLVKLVTSFLLSYPLAGLLKRVPDAKPALKNLFIIRLATCTEKGKN